jgi:hypothetical protein
MLLMFAPRKKVGAAEKKALEAPKGAGPDTAEDGR